MLLQGLEAYGWAWALLLRKADDWAPAWERWRLHGTGDRAMFQMALPSDWICQVQICLLRAGDSAAEDESPSD